MLRRVRESLAGYEVGRRLQAVRKALIGGLDPGAQGRACGELAQGGSEPVVETGWADPARQLA